MALNENGMDTTMLVSPTGGFGGGNGLFGNGDSWLGILFLIALCNGGFGFGGLGGGYGAMMGMGMMGMDYLYPWLNNSQNINDGFREQQLATQINGIQNSITSGFGDVQLGLAGVNQAICQTGNGIVGAVTGAQNTLSQQMYSNEIANLNRSFAEQTANSQGFNGVQAGLSDLRYTAATESCATRTASAQNTRDIIDAQTRGTQAILDKLCALELDTVKSQLAQAQRDNVGLQNQLNMTNLAVSQTAQTSDIINGVYNRLSSCPVGSTPVYGNQPIFTCPQNVTNSGCGSF